MPAGFPFEQFVARVFEAEGYQTKTNQIVSGHCIDHEVDVVVNNKEKHFMVECKYHNRQKLKSNVKVTLYIKARFDDVEKGLGQIVERKILELFLVALIGITLRIYFMPWE